MNRAFRNVAWAWLLILAAPAVLLAGEVRTWTDAKGRTMQAEFVRLQGRTVHFLKNGAGFQFPVDQLSSADRAVVTRLETERALGALGAAPAASPSSPPPAAAGSQPARGSRPAKKPRLTENRRWTHQGNSATGRFIRMHEGEVVLRIANRVAKVPFHSLSQEDQAFLREALTAAGRASQIPAERSEQGGEMAGGYEDGYGPGAAEGMPGEGLAGPAGPVVGMGGYQPPRFPGANPGGIGSGFAPPGVPGGIGSGFAPPGVPGGIAAGGPANGYAPRGGGAPANGYLPGGYPPGAGAGDAGMPADAAGGYDPAMAGGYAPDTAAAAGMPADAAGGYDPAMAGGYAPDTAAAAGMPTDAAGGYDPAMAGGYAPDTAAAAGMPMDAAGGYDPAMAGGHAAGGAAPAHGYSPDGGGPYSGANATPGMGPGMAAPGMAPGMATPGMGPGMAAPGMGPGMATPGMGPGMAAPGMGPGMAAPGMGPGMAAPGMGPGMDEAADDFGGDQLASAGGMGYGGGPMGGSAPPTPPSPAIPDIKFPVFEQTGECSKCGATFSAEESRGKTHCPDCGIAWTNQGGKAGTEYSNDRRSSRLSIRGIVKLVMLAVCVIGGVLAKLFHRS